MLLPRRSSLTVRLADGVCWSHHRNRRLQLASRAPAMRFTARSSYLLLMLLSAGCSGPEDGVSEPQVREESADESPSATDFAQDSAAVEELVARYHSHLASG